LVASRVIESLKGLSVNFYFFKGATMKIVINTCFGGFGFSNLAVSEYAKLSGMRVQVDEFGDYKLINVDGEYVPTWRIKRNDLILVKIVERLGDEASGSCSRLEIVEVPAGEKYRIIEYDGNESIELESDIAWDVAT